MTDASAPGRRTPSTSTSALTGSTTRSTDITSATSTRSIGSANERAPDTILPPGHSIVTRPDGTIEVVADGERLTKTIAFRVTPTEFVALQPFIDTFPNGAVTTAMRWLIQQPAVKEEMRRQVAASRTPA